MAITKAFWYRQLRDTSLDENDRELRSGWQNVEVVSCFKKKSQSGNPMIVMGLKELSTVRKSYFYFLNNKKGAPAQLNLLIYAMNLSRGSEEDIDTDDFECDDLIGHRLTIDVEILDNNFRNIKKSRPYNPNKAVYNKKK